MYQSNDVSLIQRYGPDGRVTVVLIGELDASSRPAVEARLHELAEAGDVTIDLARTRFIDLGSVRMLVGCRERAQMSGHAVEIVNSPSYVTRMLAMLERGHYWRPQRFLRTTTDEQRSRPDSEQIVRLQCSGCGNQTFLPEGGADRACEVCGATLDRVAVFRDRRRTRQPVAVERRRQHR